MYINDVTIQKIAESMCTAYMDISMLHAGSITYMSEMHNHSVRVYAMLVNDAHSRWLPNGHQRAIPVPCKFNVFHRRSIW